MQQRPSETAEAINGAMGKVGEGDEAIEKAVIQMCIYAQEEVQNVRAKLFELGFPLFVLTTITI